MLTEFNVVALVIWYIGWQQPEHGTVSVSLINELKRRKVIRVGIAYLALAWLVVQVAETLLPAYKEAIACLGLASRARMLPPELVDEAAPLSVETVD